MFGRVVVDEPNRNSEIQSLKFLADGFDQIGFDGKPDRFSLPAKPVVQNYSGKRRSLPRSRSVADGNSGSCAIWQSLFVGLSGVNDALELKRRN